MNDRKPGQEETYGAPPPMASIADGGQAAIALTLPLVNLPETVTINGVEYRRAGDWVDTQVNKIRDYQAIARRAGISLKRAVWFPHNFSDVLPD